MNTSLAHLPEEVQDKLSRLVGYIRSEVPEIQYIILYGSYARGDYVDYDQRIEYGLRTCYQSDFDIVALTPKRKAAQVSIDRRLRNASAKYARGHADFKVPPVEFFVEFVEDFNAHIAEGQYLYTDIVKEGIVLYNSGEYELEPVRELNYTQIANLSKKYYTAKFARGKGRLKAAKFYYNEGDYVDGSFDLHQATEKFLQAIILTACHYSKKSHNIIEMLQKTKLFTTVAVEIFHTDTAESNRLLKLLQSAYIESRYNDDFVMPKEDYEKLLEMVERLQVATEKFCLETIAEHEQRAQQ